MFSPLAEIRFLWHREQSSSSWNSQYSAPVIQECCSPVGMADCAPPALCSHAHAAPAADPVAASEAQSAWVPELSQRPLTAGTRPLAVLVGVALCASPSKLLQVMLHPPDDNDKYSFNWAAEENFDNYYFCQVTPKASPYPVLLKGAQLLVSSEHLQDYFSVLSLKQT